MALLRRLVLDAPAAALAWLGRQGTRAVAALILIGIAVPPLLVPLDRDLVSQNHCVHKRLRKNRGASDRLRPCRSAPWWLRCLLSVRRLLFARFLVSPWCPGFWRLSVRPVHILLVFALAHAAPMSSFSQTHECLDNSVATDRNAMPPPDVPRSLAWLRMQQTSDPEAMRALVGDWHDARRRAGSDTLLITRHRFEPDGLYRYTETCGDTSKTCPPKSGSGSYRAARASNGSISVMIKLSDSNRSNHCISGEVVTTGPSILVMEDGEAWVKM
jgi:hypothetical protein